MKSVTISLCELAAMSIAAAPARPRMTRAQAMELHH